MKVGFAGKPDRAGSGCAPAARMLRVSVTPHGALADALGLVIGAQPGIEINVERPDVTLLIEQVIGAAPQDAGPRALILAPRHGSLLRAWNLGIRALIGI